MWGGWDNGLIEGGIGPKWGNGGLGLKGEKCLGIGPWGPKGNIWGPKPNNLLLLCILLISNNPNLGSMKNLPLLLFSSSNLSIKSFKEKNLLGLGYILCLSILSLIHLLGCFLITSFKLLPKISSFKSKLKKWASSISFHGQPYWRTCPAASGIRRTTSPHIYSWQSGIIVWI